MAQIIGKIAASPSTGAVIRTDRRDRPFVQVQDTDTNQYFTVYSRKDLALFASGKKLSTGKRYSFIGTLHALGENVKMIATKVTVKR